MKIGPDITDNKEDFEKAKETALEIIGILHEKHGDNIYVACQAAKFTLEGLLPEIDGFVEEWSKTNQN